MINVEGRVLETMNYVVDFKKKLVRLTLPIFLFGSLYGCESNTVELKAKEFETPVKEDISLAASTYLKAVKKDSKISFEDSNLDINKIGTYDVIIKYDNKEYAIKVKVVDKEKPVIAIHKKLFVFDLKTSVKEVNKAINKEIKITDNYDKIFNDLNVIISIPKEEKEVVCKLNVKDTSDNVSESVEIKVQFTKNGKEKTGLKQETKTVETTVNIKENEKSLANSKTDTTKKDGGKSTSSSTNNNSDKLKDNDKSNSDKDSNKKPSNGNGNVANNGNQGGNGSNSDTGSNGGSNTNKPAEKPSKPSTPNKPSEPPRPNEQPKPDKPVQKPQLTVANAPDWMRNAGFIKLFNTDDEAYEWANNQIRIEGSPYYGMTSIVTGDLSDDDNFTGVIWGVNIY